jgi:predicted ATPase
MLILLDNAEHLLPDLAPVVARLLAASDRLTVLITSRERLRLAAEHIFPVPPLTRQDAVALFRQYAAALGLQFDQTGTIEALCERLDRLPLAIQLAAARLRTMTPQQLLDRIAVRLDLLKGVRDLEPRQQTLRTTIAWSHDLLTSAEQVLFRRLAVFAGGATVEAAEAVCDAGIDPLEGLVDKSLVQRSDEIPHPRFEMLEAIGDFAAEHLDQSGERGHIRARHGQYFSQLVERMEEALGAGHPEEGPVAILEAEIVNLRAAVDFALEAGDHDLVRKITAALPLYWISRGLFTEARTWLDRAIALEGPDDDMRRRLLSALAGIAYQQGDHAAAVAASDEAAALAMRLGGVTEQYQQLRDQIRAARIRGDLDEAERLLEEALVVAITADNGVGTSACRLGLASLANKTGRHDRAQALLTENLPFVQGKGQTRCEAYTLAGMAETSVYSGQLDRVVDVSLRGARRAAQIDDRPLVASLLDLLAVGEAARGHTRLAATLLGATEAAREAMGAAPDDEETAIRTRALGLLGTDLSSVADAWAAGRGLDLGSALELTKRA